MDGVWAWCCGRGRGAAGAEERRRQAPWAPPPGLRAAPPPPALPAAPLPASKAPRSACAGAGAGGEGVGDRCLSLRALERPHVSPGEPAHLLLIAPPPQSRPTGGQGWARFSATARRLSAYLCGAKRPKGDGRSPAKAPANFRPCRRSGHRPQRSPRPSASPAGCPPQPAIACKHHTELKKSGGAEGFLTNGMSVAAAGSLTVAAGAAGRLRMAAPHCPAHPERALSMLARALPPAPPCSRAEHGSSAVQQAWHAALHASAITSSSTAPSAAAPPPFSSLSRATSAAHVWQRLSPASSGTRGSVSQLQTCGRGGDGGGALRVHGALPARLQPLPGPAPHELQAQPAPASIMLRSGSLKNSCPTVCPPSHTACRTKGTPAASSCAATWSSESACAWRGARAGLGGRVRRRCWCPAGCTAGQLTCQYVPAHMRGHHTHHHSRRRCTHLKTQVVARGVDLGAARHRRALDEVQAQPVAPQPAAGWRGWGDHSMLHRTASWRARQRQPAARTSSRRPRRPNSVGA